MLSAAELELPGCVIQARGGSFTCRDTGAETTAIDGNLLCPDVPYVLGNGQRIRLEGGKLEYEVHIEGGYAGDFATKMMFEAMKASFPEMD